MRYFSPFHSLHAVPHRPQAAIEIMNLHSADVADRPRSVAAGEIISGNNRLLLSSGKDLVRKLRTWVP